ncbi:MAG: hypothetical protein D3904_09195 [Candidatus Electrothrix sp. EH2]|nr:hypothetical protein [Candidatus Electrothrix sp. EH2]
MKIKNFISPNYTEEKLEPPFYKDTVDVFEDRIRYWVLAPAKKLLTCRNDHIAAMQIMINYIEGIQIYLSGKDSNRQSYQFFEAAFFKIFKINAEDKARSHAAKAIYSQIRCGFSHDGMSRHNVLYDVNLKHVFLLTWERKGDVFLYDKGVKSILVNPRKFYQGIEGHFEGYIERLKRMKKNDKLVDNFKDAVQLKWNLGNITPIGVTEQEYYKNYSQHHAV